MACIYKMKYYSSIKNNELQPFATTWIDIEDIMLSEISHMDKDKLLYDFTYMWNLKKKKERKEQTK